MPAQRDGVGGVPGPKPRPSNIPSPEEVGPEFPYFDQSLSDITEEEIRKFDAILFRLARFGKSQACAGEPATYASEMEKLRDIYNELQTAGNELAMRSDVVFARVAWQLTWARISGGRKLHR